MPSSGADKDGRNASAPPMRMSLFGRSKAAAPADQPAGSAPEPRKFLGVTIPSMRSRRKSDTAVRDLDAQVTARDLAPTSAAKETGGDATQGDFLMAAKARRRQLAEQGRQTDPSDTASGTSMLDDSSIHVGGAPHPAGAPPPRRIPPTEGGLGDIDAPHAPAIGSGGGLSDIDVPRQN